MDRRCPRDRLSRQRVGDDAASPAFYHNNFQDPEKFLQAGGLRGRQLQTLVEGTYYINRLFATVEMVPKTVVEVGNVGVVVSYTGEVGVDLTGDLYKHGELVKRTRAASGGSAAAGKYAFNTYAGKVTMVPTTNFILKWNKSESGSHKIRQESFGSVADHERYVRAVSAAVGRGPHRLPESSTGDPALRRYQAPGQQTLDPMVSAYFQNIGQTRTLIQLIQGRSAIQQLSGEQMKAKFAQNNLELQEVLIGTPTSGAVGSQIKTILTQLRSRQIAEEQVETYTRQEKAAMKKKELREAESRAKQQTFITESELSISIQSNQGKAEYERSRQEAARIQTLATAEAEKIRILGEGEAKKIQAIAGADAERTARVGSHKRWRSRSRCAPTAAHDCN